MNKTTQNADLPEDTDTDNTAETDTESQAESAPTREVGGPKGLEPTRYGDWEKAGRCIDF